MVELETGAVRDRTRDDLVTRSTAVRPAKHVDVDGVWSTFLAEAVPEDALDWLEAVAGYSATAHTREHLLLFIYGPGGSGKGTWLTAIADAMGGYARRINPSDLMDQRGAEPHPAWLADLDGRRLVIGDDVKRGAKWATGRVKGLVSGEPIRARRMRQDFYEFKPAAQVILVGITRRLSTRATRGCRGGCECCRSLTSPRGPTLCCRPGSTRPKCCAGSSTARAATCATDSPRRRRPCSPLPRGTRRRRTRSRSSSRR